MKICTHRCSECTYDVNLIISTLFVRLECTLHSTRWIDFHRHICPSYAWHTKISNHDTKGIRFHLYVYLYLHTIYHHRVCNSIDYFMYLHILMHVFVYARYITATVYTLYTHMGTSTIYDKTRLNRLLLLLNMFFNRGDSLIYCLWVILIIIIIESTESWDKCSY